MPRDIDISARQKRAQQDMFREADRRGITVKAIHFDTGISQDTIRSWVRGEAVMSIAGLFGLVGVIPDDLLSMLLPERHAIVRLPDGIDHDDFEDRCRDFLGTKGHAHHPDSPAGREISDCEKDVLDRKVVALRAA